MARVLAALLAVAVLGCGPAHGDAWINTMAAAKRAYSAGRYSEAAKAFATAATSAKRLKDRDEALFMQARMLRRMGNDEGAIAVYKKLIASSPRGPRHGRAAFEIAGLTIEHVDATRGWQMLQQAIEEFPDHGAARGAIRKLVAHLDETNRKALAELLNRWLTKLRGSDSEQRVKYELARLAARRGDKKKALQLMLRAAREHPYPKGNLTDDALWRASLYAEELGEAARAIAILQELLATREVAQGGSYERPRFPQAQMRIAQLYRDRLGDMARARREFRRTYTLHSTSILADDAMWQEALMALRMRDSEGACGIVRELPSRFPRSRYRRCVREICPAAVAASKDPCPRYIMRSINGNEETTTP